MLRTRTDYRKISADLIRTLRGDRKQQAINSGLRASYNVVSRWERGTKMPSWSEFQRFCSIVGVDLEPSLRMYVFGNKKSPLSSEEVCASLMSDLSLAFVAEKTGIPTTTLHGFRTGKSEVTLPAFLCLFEARYDLTLLLARLTRRLPVLDQVMTRAEKTRQLRIRFPEGVFALALMRLDAYRDALTDDARLLRNCLGLDRKRQAEMLDLLALHGFAKKGDDGRYEPIAAPAESDGRSEPALFHRSYARMLGVIRGLAGKSNYEAGRARMGFLLFPSNAALEQWICQECIQCDRRIHQIVGLEAKKRIKTSVVSVYALQLFPVEGFRLRIQPPSGGRAPGLDRRAAQTLATALLAHVSRAGARAPEAKSAANLAWSRFRSICRDSGVGLSDDAPTRRQLFLELAPTQDIAELARRSGYSASLLRKWRSGSVEMSLVAALVFMELSGTLRGFLRTLAPSKALLSAHARLQGSDRVLIDARKPASEMRDRIPLEHHDGHHREKMLWFERNLKAFSEADPSKPVFQGCFFRPCSPEGARRIREELQALYWRIAAAVDAGPAGEFDRLSMLSLQGIEPEI